jgi:hypothetical protein
VLQDKELAIGIFVVYIFQQVLIFLGIFYIDTSIPVHQQIICVVLPVIPHQDIPQFKN